MRYLFQRTVADGDGNVIYGATVSAVLSGTSTAAKMYSSVTSTVAIYSTTTAIDGSYKFYTDDFDYD